MAPIQIADEEILAAIDRLATHLQQSPEEAIATAIREKIEREQIDRSEPSPKELVEKWMKITEGFGKRWPEPWKTTPHGDLLYDERGLPK